MENTGGYHQEICLRCQPRLQLLEKQHNERFASLKRKVISTDMLINKFQEVSKNLATCKAELQTETTKRKQQENRSTASMKESMEERDLLKLVNKRHERRLKQLELQLQTSAEEILAAKKTAEQYRAQAKTDTAKIAELQAENKELKVQMKMKQVKSKEPDTLNKKLEKAQATIGELQQQIKSMKKELQNQKTGQLSLGCSTLPVKEGRYQRRRKQPAKRVMELPLLTGVMTSGSSSDLDSDDDVILRELQRLPDPDSAQSDSGISENVTQRSSSVDISVASPPQIIKRPPPEMDTRESSDSETNTMLCLKEMLNPRNRPMLSPFRPTTCRKRISPSREKRVSLISPVTEAMNPQSSSMEASDVTVRSVQACSERLGVQCITEHATAQISSEVSTSHEDTSQHLTVESRSPRSQLSGAIPNTQPPQQQEIAVKHHNISKNNSSHTHSVDDHQTENKIITKEQESLAQNALSATDHCVSSSRNYLPEIETRPDTCSPNNSTHAQVLSNAEKTGETRTAEQTESNLQPLTRKPIMIARKVLRRPAPTLPENDLLSRKHPMRLSIQSQSSADAILDDLPTDGVEADDLMQTDYQSAPIGGKKRISRVAGDNIIRDQTTSSINQEPSEPLPKKKGRQSKINGLVQTSRRGRSNQRTADICQTLTCPTTDETSGILEPTDAIITQSREMKLSPTKPMSKKHAAISSDLTDNTACVEVQPLSPVEAAEVSSVARRQQRMKVNLDAMKQAQIGAKATAIKEEKVASAWEQALMKRSSLRSSHGSLALYEAKASPSLAAKEDISASIPPPETVPLVPEEECNADVNPVAVTSPRRASMRLKIARDNNKKNESLHPVKQKSLIENKPPVEAITIALQQALSTIQSKEDQSMDCVKKDNPSDAVIDLLSSSSDEDETQSESIVIVTKLPKKTPVQIVDEDANLQAITLKANGESDKTMVTDPAQAERTLEHMNGAKEIPESINDPDTALDDVIMTDAGAYEENLSLAPAMAANCGQKSDFTTQEQEKQELTDQSNIGDNLTVVTVKQPNGKESDKKSNRKRKSAVQEKPTPRIPVPAATGGRLTRAMKAELEKKQMNNSGTNQDTQKKAADLTMQSCVDSCEEDCTAADWKTSKTTSDTVETILQNDGSPRRKRICLSKSDNDNSTPVVESRAEVGACNLKKNSRRSGSSAISKAYEVLLKRIMMKGEKVPSKIKAMASPLSRKPATTITVGYVSRKRKSTSSESEVEPSPSRIVRFSTEVARRSPDPIFLSPAPSPNPSNVENASMSNDALKQNTHISDQNTSEKRHHVPAGDQVNTSIQSDELKEPISTKPDFSDKDLKDSTMRKEELQPPEDILKPSIPGTKLNANAGVVSTDSSGEEAGLLIDIPEESPDLSDEESPQSPDMLHEDTPTTTFFNKEQLRVIPTSPEKSLLVTNSLPRIIPTTPKKVTKSGSDCASLETGLSENIQIIPTSTEDKNSDIAIVSVDNQEKCELDTPVASVEIVNGNVTEDSVINSPPKTPVSCDNKLVGSCIKHRVSTSIRTDDSYEQTEDMQAIKCNISESKMDEPEIIPTHTERLQETHQSNSPRPTKAKAAVTVTHDRDAACVVALFNALDLQPLFSLDEDATRIPRCLSPVKNIEPKQPVSSMPLDTIQLTPLPVIPASQKMPIYPNPAQAFAAKQLAMRTMFVPTKPPANLNSKKKKKKKKRKGNSQYKQGDGNQKKPGSNQNGSSFWDPDAVVSNHVRNPCQVQYSRVPPPHQPAGRISTVYDDDLFGGDNSMTITQKSMATHPLKQAATLNRPKQPSVNHTAKLAKKLEMYKERIQKKYGATFIPAQSLPDQTPDKTATIIDPPSR